MGTLGANVKPTPQSRPAQGLRTPGCLYTFRIRCFHMGTFWCPVQEEVQLQEAWGGAEGFAFITNSWVTLLEKGPHFENR